MKNEIIKRFVADTPTFFKRLRNIGASISATGIALVAINGVPHTIIAIATQMIWVGSVVAAVSQLACKNPEELKK